MRILLFTCSLVVLCLLLACSGAATSTVESTSGPPSNTQPASPPSPESEPADPVNENEITLGESEPAKLTPLAVLARRVLANGLNDVPEIAASDLEINTITRLNEGVEVMAVYGQTIHCMSTETDTVLFLEGYDTTNIVTGKTLNIGRVLVAGVRRYNNVLGSQSSGFTVAPISDSEWSNAVSSAMAEIKREKIEYIEGKIAALKTKFGGEMRDWTDATGEHKIKASLTDYKDGFVLLRKEDGTDTSLPLENLSKPDQGYVTRRVALRGKDNREIQQLEKELADLQ